MFLKLLSVLAVQSYVLINFVKCSQYFGKTPSNLTVTLGDNVSLPCIVYNKSGLVQWMANGFGVGAEIDLNSIDRYSMKVSKVTGEHNLEISFVTLDDDGFFECQVSAGIDGTEQIRSNLAHLTVEVPTSPPKIVQGPLLQITEGEFKFLDCVSEDGKPAAKVVFFTKKSN